MTARAHVLALAAVIVGLQLPAGRWGKVIRQAGIAGSE